MSSANGTLSPYVSPLPGLFGQAVATGSARPKPKPRKKKLIVQQYAAPLIDRIADEAMAKRKPLKPRKLPKGILTQAVFGPAHVGAAPRVSDIKFKHPTPDLKERIVYDEGKIFFNNGWGACVRRHYEHHGNKKTFVYYSVAVLVLFRGGHHAYSYKWKLPEDAPVIEGNFRQIFPKTKVENPHSFTENDKEILAINAFLRSVQYLRRHSKAPDPKQIKTYAEQLNIKEGLPQKLKPQQREPSFDI